MATAASASKSLEVSSSDLNSDVAVKKCNSTTVLETKKLKNWASSKQNEGSNLSQSLVCKICHQNICNKRMMRRHMFLHEGLKPFECADCGQSFTRKENMKSHIFSMHMPYQSRPYKCDICSKFYSYQRDLKNHRCSTSTIPKKVSDGRQSLVCNICHKHFSHQQSLKRHMLIHEGVKPFECAECGKSFRRKYDMNQHIGQYCSAKLSEFTSADVDDDVTIKERDSTTVLEAKKVEKLVSSKRKKNSILNESCNQNTSKRGRSNTDDGFDFSSIPKVYVSLPKLDWGYGDPLTSNSLHIESNSFSNEHAEEFCTSAAASASKSLEVSSLDSNNDVAVKKCNLKTVFKTKKLKNWASSERNEAPNLGTSLVCNICHQNIGNQDQMRRHMFLHGDLKPFECADCGKSFTRKENMMVHIFSMHMPYLTVNIPYKCDPCNKFYSSLSDLNKNRSSTTLRDHSTQVSNGCQSPVCNICRKNFCNQRNLEKHMLIHEGLKPFKCAECGESFGRKFVMNQHITECHTPYHTRPYNCDVCGKRYAAQYRLNRHKRLSGHYCSSKLSKFTSADVDDSVSVMDCDSTTVLGDKKVRKLVSSKQKKNSNPSQFFVCKVCNRNYSTRHSLKRHLNSHEGLKPFKCAECDRSFARKHDMKQHIIVVHINDLRFLDTRYYCAHCKYRCQSKESLVYHIKRNHVSNLCLDEFSCSTCGKTFKRRYDRKVHEQRVHVEKKCFCCMNCGNRYKHDSGLIKHLELEQCVLE
ncbi:zinc finger protein 678-like [Planococcus citri]|uniref:zinc finger protein 678-like n=1 Tax=Planococcus citri TaxID=170843 RepID=UPI0031F9BE5B